MSDVASEEVVSLYPNPASQEMIDAGVFYGRKKSRTHPKMKSYVLANRAGIEIINLEKTAESLEKALAFIKEKIKLGGQVIVVGTEPQAEEAVVALAQQYSLLSVTHRWAGGTLTNFKVISKRIEYFKKLVSDLAHGALDKYTKKERLGIEREINRLRELFGGLEHFEKLPDVMIVVNAHVHTSALREARRLRIPIVAFANVDTDPVGIDYLVPGNDKSLKSIRWFLEKIGGAIREGLAEKAASVAASAPVTAGATSTEIDIKTHERVLTHEQKPE